MSLDIALSIQQPWAWLIVNGYKDVENRTWATRRRGRILVHAGKTFDRDGYDWIEVEYRHIKMPPISAFERGGIVGEVEITGCVEVSNSSWFFGPFGLTLANGRPLPFRPYRGALGFFPVELPAPPRAPQEPK